jgi:hypothetical protein
MKQTHATVAVSINVADLEKISDLFDRGFLSDEEFREAKRRLFE